MLLIDDARVDERRKAAQGPLAPLYQSLAAELAPAISRDIYIPREKALLSRVGGRCERDGSNLEFDPFSPRSHRCPSCGTVYAGEWHDRAWITWYHLWLAERAVHASLFHALTGEQRCADFASRVLREYAEAYLTYPNVDNVLGPTRPFFSTYLESIWLLQLCVAADLLQQAGDRATADLVRDRIIEPSSALIAGFDEGSSNRQVWNNAAMLASALLLRDKKRCDEIVNAKSGVAAHLTQALLSDGTWFEGDNYHQFAIRGLWYAVTMCEANGVALTPDQTRSFDGGIAATFASALPDFTFPSRKDSQYAVSLRQWRFAELAELGFARTRDDQLGSALSRCYEAGQERRDTGRARSTADAERNSQSSSLTRADLGWRALLHAVPELPPLAAAEPRSIHLTGQGLAVFRRPGDVYVAMDYGQSGAGHGHPDRLNLLLAQGSTRWLDDLGTGSYVDKTLHWYRSSLAHNAPFVDGRSQKGADGRLLAYDERGDIGWIEAQFRDGDVTLTRSLVITPDYLVDELTWTALHEVQVDLPWHVDLRVEGVSLRPATPDGGDGPEDGFDFAHDWSGGTLEPGQPMRLGARADGRQLAVWLEAKGVASLLRGEGPGQPAAQERPFYMVRSRGAQGRLRSVVAWNVSIRSCEFDESRVRLDAGDGRHTHMRTASGWRLEARRSSGTTNTELGGRSTVPVQNRKAPEPQRTRIRQPTVGGWWSEVSDADRKRMCRVELGEANYRSSEQSWLEAHSPSATVAVSGADHELELFIDVRAANQRFASANAVNPFDNEHADTMGAGVQLYLDTSRASGKWMLVPEVGSDRVRVRAISGSTHASTPQARWRSHHHGYELYVFLPKAPFTYDFRALVSEFATETPNQADLTVIINDAVTGRERRRGQLITGDARGEFVYLRGDRDDGRHALHLDMVL